MARYCNRWTSRKGLIACNLEVAVSGGGKSDPKDTEKARKQTSSSLCNSFNFQLVLILLRIYWEAICAGYIHGPL